MTIDRRELNERLATKIREEVQGALALTGRRPEKVAGDLADAIIVMLHDAGMLLVDDLNEVSGFEDGRRAVQREARVWNGAGDMDAVTWLAGTKVAHDGVVRPTVSQVGDVIAHGMVAGATALAIAQLLEERGWLNTPIDPDELMDGREAYGAWCDALRRHYRIAPGLLQLASADDQGTPPRDYAFVPKAEQRAWQAIAAAWSQGISIDELFAALDNEQTQPLRDALQAEFSGLREAITTNATTAADGGDRR